MTIVEVVQSYADAFVKWCCDNEWIGSSSLFLVTPGEGLDKMAIELGETVGFDTATLKYVLMLLLCYPLSFIFARLPSPTIKHIYSFLVGVWMMQFVFYSQWIHSLITTAVTYIMVLTLPNKYMPQVVFTFVMAYISFSHIYRQYVDWMGWSLDFTGPQMVLTIKLSSFAYNVHDGRAWAEIEKDTGDPKKDRVLAQRRKYALRTMPSLLEYLGYIFSFFAILAGPAFEYTEYITTVTGAKFQKNGTPGKMPSSNIPASLLRLGVGLLCLAAYQIGGPMYPVMDYPTDKVLSLPFLKRVLHVYVGLFFCRAKYFFAWKVSDGAAIMGGFGFEGYDKDDNAIGWNGVSNIEIVDFELASNVVETSRMWNKRTQGWLERYVYMRTGNSLTATYFVSAFWHGFYPGYYLFFMTLPVATSVARAGRKKISPYFAHRNAISSIYNVLCVMVNSLSVNYYVLPFQMLSWEYSVAVWGSFYFAVHIGLVVVFALCKVIPTKKDAKKTA